eukprot:2728769-Pyramimonas_sp.AAC.2
MGGGLNNDTAKAVLRAQGAELRMRARQQRATTIEAINRLLRHQLHVVEAELNSKVSPCNALIGRQPAMLPDLPVLDHEQPTGTSDHSQEQVIREVRIEAITQATAVAKTTRALRTKASISGQQYYDEGDLVDYHRPATTRGDRGGWNGPFPFVRNDPDMGQVIIRVGNRDVQ